MPESDKRDKRLPGIDLGACRETPLLPLVLRRLLPPAGGFDAPVWIQGVSLGEAEVALTLADELRRRRPGLRVLVTSTTPAGVSLVTRRVAQREGLVARAFPLDLPFSLRRFLAAAQPRVLVLVETELWPGLLAAARRRGMPVLLVSARLSERSARRIRAARALFGTRLLALHRVLARSEEDAARFASIGIEAGRISVSGDLKFDRSPPLAPDWAPACARLAAGRDVVVLGSLADEEIPLVAPLRVALRGAGADPFLLVAPRRPGSFDDAAESLARNGFKVARRSALEAAPEETDLLLLDTIGELAGAYALGRAALVGGTFAPKGGHNVLEPLRVGVPAVVGPSVANLRATLAETGVAVARTGDVGGAGRALALFLADEAVRTAARRDAAALFARHAGASARAAEAVLSLLPEPA